MAYDGSNALLASAVFGPGIDQPISMFRDGENYYYHSDALGSIYQMTDSDEAVVKSYDYSAFGKIISESGTLPFNNPFTYTAREYDSESGLYYYRFRYYDPEVGRFLSRDPIGYMAGVNLYAYVGNNALNWMDPSGLWDSSTDAMNELIWGPLDGTIRYSYGRTSYWGRKGAAQGMRAGSWASGRASGAAGWVGAIPLDYQIKIPSLPTPWGPTPPVDPTVPLALFGFLEEPLDDLSNYLDDKADCVDPDTPCP